MGTGILGRAPGVWLGVSCSYMAASFYFILDVGNDAERRWEHLVRRGCCWLLGLGSRVFVVGHRGMRRVEEVSEGG